MELTYDSSFRLVSITDAIGQVTTLDYLDSGHPLAITKVTDPFGRFATMTYDALGRLATITDVVGMTSSFAYGDGDFIAGDDDAVWHHHVPARGAVFHARRIEATDPAGGTERLEYHVSHAGLSEHGVVERGADRLQHLQRQHEQVRRGVLGQAGDGGGADAQQRDDHAIWWSAPTDYDGHALGAQPAAQHQAAAREPRLVRLPGHATRGHGAGTTTVADQDRPACSRAARHRSRR